MVVGSKFSSHLLSIVLRYLFLGSVVFSLIVSLGDTPAISKSQVTRQVLPAAITPSLIPSTTPSATPTIFVKRFAKSRAIIPTTVLADNAVVAPSDILAALNAYRQKKGRGVLVWSDVLGGIAQGRVATFVRIGTLDSHAGFRLYFAQMPGIGFTGLGENSSYGYHISATDLIEQAYAGDEPHDQNQLNPDWTHVGIAALGVATDVVFGRK